MKAVISVIRSSYGVGRSVLTPVGRIVEIEAVGNGFRRFGSVDPFERADALADTVR